jgi:hypothetical protein
MKKAFISSKAARCDFLTRTPNGIPPNGIAFSLERKNSVREEPSMLVDLTGEKGLGGPDGVNGPDSRSGGTSLYDSGIWRS